MSLISLIFFSGISTDSSDPSEEYLTPIQVRDWPKLATFSPRAAHNNKATDTSERNRRFVCRANCYEERVIDVNFEPRERGVVEALGRSAAKACNPSPKGWGCSASKNEDVEHTVLVSHPHNLILRLTLVNMDHVECVPHVDGKQVEGGFD
eukprot:3855451-Amphidinium_carterae.3